MSNNKKTDDSVNLEWQEIEKQIHSLAADQSPGRRKILADIFRSAVKLTQDSPGTLNLKISSSVLKELRHSFRKFAPYKHIPKITIFGSARVPSDKPLYRLAKSFAAEAVKRNYMIITGGGPGIMAAGNEGAEKYGFGLNIRLPVEQSANQFIDAEKLLINYKYFFTRKLFLVKEAAAFAFFPGGFGTFDEAFEVLTLLQTGKTNMIPVVFIEPKGFGFWEPLVKFMEGVMLKKGFISKEDKALYKVFHSEEKALDYIAHFYRNYHSMRFVGENLVIRIRKQLGAQHLKKANQLFPTLTHLGKIQPSAALPDEHNEPELLELPRLVFPFDRKDFGSLRSLIDFINDCKV